MNKNRGSKYRNGLKAEIRTRIKTETPSEPSGRDEFEEEIQDVKREGVPEATENPRSPRRAFYESNRSFRGNFGSVRLSNTDGERKTKPGWNRAAVECRER